MLNLFPTPCMCMKYCTPYPHAAESRRYLPDDSAVERSEAERGAMRNASGKGIVGRTANPAADAPWNDARRPGDFEEPQVGCQAPCGHQGHLARQPASGSPAGQCWSAWAKLGSVGRVQISSRPGRTVHCIHGFSLSPKPWSKTGTKLWVSDVINRRCQLLFGHVSVNLLINHSLPKRSIQG